MSEEKLSPEQSLRLIHTMIDRTKETMSDNGIHYLVWGWLTFFACTAQFILKHIYEYEKHYQVWLLMLGGVAFTFIYGFREGKRRKVQTYVGESLKWLWIGMGISYFVLSMILTRIGWNNPVFPFFIMLYGLGTFVSGSILQFRPLVTGGILASVLAMVSAFASYDYQMLYAAAAILSSYIIPAYLLRKKNKKLIRHDSTRETVI